MGVLKKVHKKDFRLVEIVEKNGVLNDCEPGEFLRQKKDVCASATALYKLSVN